jgi:energy-coupling factor transporter ATP-binding protein EcfA2
VALKPLYLQFAGRIVWIQCKNVDLDRRLRQHFRHCLGSSLAPPVTTYRIDTPKADWLQLWRDDTLLYHGLWSESTLEWLTNEVTTALIKACRERLLLHAAGLAHEGLGLILCGQSGYGKSTLAAWLTAVGFDYLTDELVAVRLNPEEMTGLPRPICLKKGSAFVWQHWLPKTARHNLIPLADETVFLEPTLLRSRSVCSFATPRIIIFPRYMAGGPFVAQPLSAGQTAFQLMRHLVNAKNIPERGFTAIARLARQVGAYCLTYTDVARAAGWIERLVSDFHCESAGD